jgi:hypothetical protein
VTDAPYPHRILKQYADDTFNPPTDWSTGGLAMSELQRLRRVALMAAVAAQFPRRLGPDALAFELAADKKLSRQIGFNAYRCWQQLVSYKGLLTEDELPPMLSPPETWRETMKAAQSDDNARKEGAVVLWKPWWAGARGALVGRRAALATYAIKAGCVLWGTRIVSSITAELNYVSIAFEDFDRAMSAHLGGE